MAFPTRTLASIHTVHRLPFSVVFDDADVTPFFSIVDENGAFASITSATLGATSGGGTTSSIAIGRGTLLGLPVKLGAITDVLDAKLDGGAVTLTNKVTADATVLAKNTLDASAGTYAITKLVVAEINSTA